MNSQDLASALSSNRTEELGFDVWDRFVIPPRLNISEWGETRKPRVIVGGRGCGKTMLLRYLSHESAFSPKRPSLDQSTLEHIGIYWRADTQFASLLQGRDQADHLWRAAFGHLSALVLGREILSALQSIATSQLRLVTPEDLERLDFSPLSTSSVPLPTTFATFVSYLEASLFEFEHWANDVHTIPQPSFLPAPALVRRLVDTVLKQLPQLHDVVFFAYIDEYENLTVLQQQVVNTWIKHSEPPLIFNVAMKRNGFKTRETLGEERLVEVHDFRPVDLEDFGQESEFSLFAAEILLLRFHNAQVPLDAFNPDLLRNPLVVAHRRTPDYSRRVFDLARELLPSWSTESLADQVFRDQALLRQLELRITKGLKLRGEQTITAVSSVGNTQDPLRSSCPRFSLDTGSPRSRSRKSLTSTAPENQTDSSRERIGCTISFSPPIWICSRPSFVRAPSTAVSIPIAICPRATCATSLNCVTRPLPRRLLRIPLPSRPSNKRKRPAKWPSAYSPKSEVLEASATTFTPFFYALVACSHCPSDERHRANQSAPILRSRTVKTPSPTTQSPF